MNDPIDLLQIKIDKAKIGLPEETRRAIDAIDWRNVILGMRQNKGYSFEQLGNLEIETELLLCGLLNPEDYPKELENRMGIPKAKVNELVEEMNQLVFGKIREELIKNGEQKKMFASHLKASSADNNQEKSTLNTQINKDEAQVLDKAGIKILPNLNTPELGAPSNSILSQKLTNPIKIPSTKTEHTPGNVSKPVPSYPPKADPYRLPPE